MKGEKFKGREKSYLWSWNSIGRLVERKRTKKKHRNLLFRIEACRKERRLFSGKGQGDGEEVSFSGSKLKRQRTESGQRVKGSHGGGREEARKTGVGNL